MKRTSAFFAPALIACAALSPIMAKADGAEGRALYHGHAGFARGDAATNLRLPSEFAACAKCHGAFGEGGREGGVTAPALIWSALTTPRGEAPAFQAESQVLDAITKGVARDGAALGPTMPRYTLSDAEMSALLDYLKHVGRADDYPPGVDRQTIRLATMLPLSGAARAVGLAVLDGMRGAFDAANSNGGVYGRKLVLEAIDIEQDAQALTKDVALRRPFAVVGGMWRPDAPISLELAKQRIAKIATLTPHRDALSLDAWDIDLLAPLDQQRSAIESALKNCAAPGPKWAIAGNIAIASTPMADRRWFASAAEAADAAKQIASPGCVAYGLADAAAVNAAMPATWEKRLILPFPAAIFLVGREESSSPWQALGRAAARLVVELCARAGSRLNERSPLMALEKGLRVELEAGAPAYFDRARHYAWNPDIITISAGAPRIRRKQF
ncbi:cytochrome c [Methylocystis sp. SC2]|uniref:cytochrome c/ABC transporter substrate-binding protein n=1 Tax=Methylocystis sp. (strain SC2) TaxID=187303 RepID=UPI00027AEA67|nr:cytochrome c [Methylocystis sp. SC2]CCJ05625.1 Putative Cytochrome c [Methylocystis sp. SC2]